MTARDRTVLIVLALVGVVAAAYFFALAPKRDEVKELDGKIAAAQTRLTTAEAAEAAGVAAQAGYKRDYAAVAKLGKAVPADDDVPSLVLQVQGAADRAKVDFRSIELSANAGAAAGVLATNTAAIAAAAGTTGASGASGATGAVAATQTAAATLPPGAAVGSAGFPTMPFDFQFNGSFFRLQDMLSQLDAFTKVRGQQIAVSGRLLTVDGFSLTAGPTGFPNMVASIHATAYVVPTDQAAAAAAAPTATTIPTGATP